LEVLFGDLDISTNVILSKGTKGLRKGPVVIHELPVVARLGAERLGGDDPHTTCVRGVDVLCCIGTICAASEDDTRDVKHGAYPLGCSGSILTLYIRREGEDLQKTFYEVV
jgi:hypothetical protein